MSSPHSISQQTGSPAQWSPRWWLTLSEGEGSAYELYSLADQARLRALSQAQAVIPDHERRGLPTISINSEGVSAHLSTLKRPFSVSFTAGEIARRAAQKAETLCRVTGAHRGGRVRILDATAGLGREAYLMSSAGAHVDAIERSFPLYLLTYAALKVAQRERASSSMFTLAFGESQEVYQEHKTTPDVVYLDPMFPLKTKHVQVGREAQILQAFTAPPDPSSEANLITWALDIAACRVVVKRPIKAPPLPGPSPTSSVRGRAVRFDLYGKRRLP